MGDAGQGQIEDAQDIVAPHTPGDDDDDDDDDDEVFIGCSGKHLSAGGPMLPLVDSLIMIGKMQMMVMHKEMIITMPKHLVIQHIHHMSQEDLAVAIDLKDPEDQ